LVIREEANIKRRVYKFHGSASALITPVVIGRQAFIFAEPGAIYVDIHPINTYLLVRCESGTMLLEETLRLHAENATMEILQILDQYKLVAYAKKNSLSQRE